MDDGQPKLLKEAFMHRSKPVFSLFIFAVLYLTLAPPAKGDEKVEGAKFVFDIVKEAVKFLTSNTGIGVCAIAEVNGPDTDDFGSSDLQCDWKEPVELNQNGLNELKIQMEDVVEGPNDKDDGTEHPYSAGSPHRADMNIVAKRDNNRHWHLSHEDTYGWASAKPDDDPTEKGQPTHAFAEGVFFLTGKTPKACFRAVSHDGELYQPAEKVPCSKSRGASWKEDLPDFSLERTAAFLTSEKRFQFVEVGSDQVLVHPLEGVVDLFHGYLQQEDTPTLFPVLRGQDAAAQDLKRQMYQFAADRTGKTLSEDPSQGADLTIVGAALRLTDLIVTRNGRSNREILMEYFSSNAVNVIAPLHTQEGYAPQVTLRQRVKSGQDVSSLLGYPARIPVNGDPGEPVEEDPLVGLLITVKGSLDEAVSQALNVEGHFVRDLARMAWDEVSETAEFELPGMDVHEEETYSQSGIATADPAPDVEPPICRLKGTTDGGIEILAQDTGSGLQAIDVLEAINAEVSYSFTVRTRDPVTVTATKNNRNERSRVQLRVRDVAGNSVVCDPVLATLRIRLRGGPSRQTFANLPESDSKITVQNSNPGLRRVILSVNGVEFKMLWLRAGEERTLDVSSAMRKGDQNVIAVTAFGPPGSTASLTIHD